MVVVKVFPEKKLVEIRRENDEEINIRKYSLKASSDILEKFMKKHSFTYIRQLKMYVKVFN